MNLRVWACRKHLGESASAILPLLSEDQDQILGSSGQAKVVQRVLVGNQKNQQEHRENGLFVLMKVLRFQNDSCYFPQSNWTISYFTSNPQQSSLLSGSKESRSQKRIKWKLKSSTTFDTPTLALQWNSSPVKNKSKLIKVIRYHIEKLLTVRLKNSASKSLCFPDFLNSVYFNCIFNMESKISVIDAEIEGIQVYQLLGTGPWVEQDQEPWHVHMYRQL